MVLASSVIVLSYVGMSASNHFEWDNYNWGQQNQGNFHGESNPTVQEEHEQFQGYPNSFYNAAPTSTSASPAQPGVSQETPKHRILLKQLYQQVLGTNFTGPDLKQLGFLSSPPSVPLNYQVQDYVQPQEARYDLPLYILPPPPVHDQFNYYS